MREYFVTTNTDVTIEAPAITVTVRTAFFNTKDVLPPEDAGVTRGAETWGGEPVAGVSFKIGGPWKMGSAVTFKDVVGLDGKTKILTKKKSRKAGIAATDVPTSQRLIELNPKRYPKKTKEVGEAKIPLFGLAEGFYVLAIVPPDKHATVPDEPAGPATVIEKGVDRTYRTLYVLFWLDSELRMRAAETVQVDSKGFVTGNEDLKGPDNKVVGKKINHGYVAAWSPDQLAIDIKPDFARSAYTIDDQKATAVSGKFKRKVDMIVVHCTSGAIIAGAFSTMVGTKKNYGPHYELDIDGHNVKYAYDDAVTWHADPATFHYAETGRSQHVINSNSIGIENVNKPHEKFREHQIVHLIALLRKLTAVHPDVKRHRIVGHGDVKTLSDKALVATVLGLSEDDVKSWNSQKVKAEIDALKGAQRATFFAKRDMMDDNKRSCPGRQMDWPRLEEKGLGREHVEKTLTAADYSGFFGIALADFPPKYPKRPTEELHLRRGDSDASQVWGGVDFTTAEAKELLKKKGLTLKDVIKEMQQDVQTLGYSINTDGEFTEKTENAVEHMIWHTFSGWRRLLAPNGNSNAPKPWVTKTVAAYLKGTAEKIAPPAAPSGGAGAAPAGGAAPAQPQHAELEMQEQEPDGMDMHDHVAMMEEELFRGPDDEPGEGVA